MVAQPLSPPSPSFAPFTVPRIPAFAEGFSPSPPRPLLSSWARRVLRGIAAIAVVAVAGSASLTYLVASVGAAAWWAFDSGPLVQSPEQILSEPSPLGAVRVYGDSPDEEPVPAARDAVDRLEAEGGFDRSTLVVALPTGSGWVDPDEITALETWAHGDVATVAVRYSRAPSGAVFVLRPDIAAESAHALLSEVTAHLDALPAEARPALVVHGQSLGAQAGAAALTDPEISRHVGAVLWQGRPGEAASPYDAPAGLGSCVVSAANAGDPVAELSWSLLADPARGLDVLAALPGSESATPGTEHSYLPVLPPTGCGRAPVPLGDRPSS